MTDNQKVILNNALWGLTRLLRDPGKLWNRLSGPEQNAVGILVDALRRIMAGG